MCHTDFTQLEFACGEVLNTTHDLAQSGQCTEDYYKKLEKDVNDNI